MTLLRYQTEAAHPQYLQCCRSFLHIRAKYLHHSYLRVPYLHVTVHHSDALSHLIYIRMFVDSEAGYIVTVLMSNNMMLGFSQIVLGEK